MYSAETFFYSFLRFVTLSRHLLRNLRLAKVETCLSVELSFAYSSKISDVSLYFWVL